MNTLTQLLYEKADYCLRTSLFYTGILLQNKEPNVGELGAYLDMRDECKPNSLWPCKSNAYHWGPYKNDEEGIDDGGSDGLTRWLYDNILKRFGKNPKKGLNGDQMRAYMTTIYAENNLISARQIWKNFKKRLFMYPSLMESLVFKPQTMYLLFKMLRKDSVFLRILYIISAMFFKFSVRRNLKEPIEETTTNKISLLVTMKLAGYKMPPDEYIIKVYEAYWNAGVDGKLIKDSIITGLIGVGKYQKYLDNKYNGK